MGVGRGFNGEGEEGKQVHDAVRTVRAQSGKKKLAHALVAEIMDLFRRPVVVAVYPHQLVQQRTLLVHRADD